MCNVITALCVLYRKILSLLHHLRQIFQRHLGAGACIVEAAVGVFLDDYLTLVLRHISLLNPV
jgi:hypothetical protein